ncbi:MAG: hypothetical protein KA160_03325, partial [Lacibacter sp.]|nr:hypothetical protein [Lacibacter sp.]
MYTKKIVIVFCLCIFSITSLLAQSALDEQSGGSPAPKKTTEKKSDDKQKMNIVKVNLMALGLKNYSFQYERVLSKHVSVALGVRTMPMNGLPLKSTIIDIVGEDDPQITQTINDLKVGNFAITPEVRFYLSKKGYGRGFYVAPYYRYATFKAEQVSIEYESGPSSTNTIKLNGDV